MNVKFYDDNQKKVRYRFGFYSLLFMAALLFIYISLPIDSLGGISYQNAIMIIIMVSALFFLVNIVYRNAFFDIYTRSPFWSNVFFLVMAGLQAQRSYQLYHLGMDLPVPINTVEFVMLHGLQVVLHLSIPLTYGVRLFVDRQTRKAKEQNAHETLDSLLEQWAFFHDSLFFCVTAFCVIVFLNEDKLIYLKRG